MQVQYPTARSRSRSRYGDSDSDRDYVPISVPLVARHHDRGRRSPETVYNNNFLIPAEAAPRRRAASTSGQPQPINLIVNPSVADDDRRRSRSRRRRDSSASSDRSRNTHRSSRYGYDREDIRREIEYENRRDELRSRSRDRDRRRELERLQDQMDEQKRRERKERQKWEDELEDKKRQEAKEKERILLEARLEEDRKKKEQDDYRKKILEEEEEKARKKKKEKEAHDKEVEEQMRQKFKALGTIMAFAHRVQDPLTKAGYSDARIDELMKGKREKQRNDREWAIDLTRPTYIKVNRKYLLPDTLDHYQLPWEWDKVSPPHHSHSTRMCLSWC
jgi:hypothetical protein